MEQNRDIFDRIMSLPGLVRFYPLYRKHKEVLMYLFFGVLTTVISIASYSLLVLKGLDALLANIVSWILAVLFAYVTNSIWVFDGHVDSVGAKFRQMMNFYAGRLTTLGLEEVILFVFIRLLGWNEYLVKLIAQILVMIGNYVISKLFVFRRR